MNAWANAAAVFAEHYGHRPTPIAEVIGNVAFAGECQGLARDIAERVAREAIEQYTSGRCAKFEVHREIKSRLEALGLRLPLLHNAATSMGRTWVGMTTTLPDRA